MQNVNADTISIELQATSPAPAELDLADALLLAIEMHQNRQLEGAETLYCRILAAAPDHPDALHFLGMLRHELGHSDEGITLIEQAVRLVPGFAGFHNNLGNIHASRGDVAGATRAYERAIALAPVSADLQNNLGALYRVQRRFAEARASYRRAIGLHDNKRQNSRERIFDRFPHVRSYSKRPKRITNDLSGRRGQLDQLLAWLLLAHDQIVGPTHNLCRRNDADIV